MTPVGVHDAEEIERGITDFASRPNGGLIVVGPPSSVASYRDLIVSLGGSLSTLSHFYTDNIAKANAKGAEVSATLRPSTSKHRGTPR